ncbi:hypothetical protein [Eisenbergiella sp.]
MLQGMIKGGSYEANVYEDHVSIRVLEGVKGTCAILRYEPDFPVDGSEYVFLPACCYNGNRFQSLKKEYPPMFEAEEASVDMPVTITDVIRQNTDGSGRITVTAGDVSVPCIGIYSPTCRKAALLYTVQEVKGCQLGLSCQDGILEIQYPHFREGKQYRAFCMVEKSDPGRDFVAGEVLEIPYRLYEWDCGGMEEFYHTFFITRKCMGMDASLPEILPFKEQWRIQREKFNTLNYREKGGFYGVGITQEATQVWQPGWVGGGMSSYAMMKLGGENEWERGMSTLRHLFKTQEPSGLFYGICSEDGELYNDAFGHAGAENWVLIRKSADVLYFLFKHFRLIRERGLEIPEEFIAGTIKLADRFVALWQEYGQFGQFVDIQSGKIMVGGSTSAGIAPAGLVCAYEFFDNPVYLETAVESAELFYNRDALHGYTTGGPGEILQGVDSESAFGLLESFVCLYEATEDKKWLDRSLFMADFCSSWVVCYNYKFPEGSEFGRLGMKTVGSVFANIQNKHSAPGICTLSGDSLYKVYKWTGEKKYLELLKEISLTISQYMSTDARPVYSWDDPPQRLLPGVICERVNLSDWENEKGVGGVFNGSCWCETSNLLTLAEVVPLLENEGKQ